MASAVVGAPALWPRLAVLASALLFSTAGSAIKATTLSGWQVASFRSAVAALAIALWILLSRQGWPRLSRGVWLVAAVHAVTMVLFVSANKLTTAASAIFLQASSPLYLLLLSPWLLGERVRRRDWLLIAVMAVGMSLFFVGQDQATATATNPRLGNALGAVAGATWALTMVGLRRLGRKEGLRADLAAVFCGNLVVAVTTLPLALPVVATARDFWVVAYLGSFQLALAYVLLVVGTRLLPALDAALLLLLEPVASALLAWWVHHEAPGFWSLCGGGLIVLGTTIKTWADARLSPAVPAPS